MGRKGFAFYLPAFAKKVSAFVKYVTLRYKNFANSLINSLTYMGRTH